MGRVVVELPGQFVAVAEVSRWVLEEERSAVAMAANGCEVIGVARARLQGVVVVCPMADRRLGQTSRRPQCGIGNDSEGWTHVDVRTDGLSARRRGISHCA